MVSELIGAVQSLKALSELMISANKLSNFNEIVSALADINMKLMQANSVALESQEKIISQQQKIQNLEEQLQSLKNWSSEVSNYETVQVSNGVFVIVSKERNSKIQSTLKYCINCFGDMKKSVLQHSNEEMRKNSLTCNRCGSKLIFNHYVETN